ncbi:MAG: L-lactate dehydrogenase complex protein LldG [Halieaceae bacterium]|jgi:L-lactate dehydrogenase complex protein LldG
MSDSSRTEIMAKVRRASGGAAAQEIAAAHARIGQGPSAILPDADIAIAFLTNVLKNSGTVAVAADRSAAVKEIGRYLFDQYHSRKLLVSNDRRLAALPWRDAGLLPRFGSAQNDDMAALSFAQIGIAETGSVLTVTGKANPSANNLLPESYIILVDIDDVVTTLNDGLNRLNLGADVETRPRGINFISGPSRTADIAMKLVTGAHGPRFWHVILLGETAENTLPRARALAAAPSNFC